MNDEDDRTLAAPVSHEDRDMLLYDHFKHLTTLALLTLGGVLTLFQTADPTDVKPEMIIAVLVIISAAGIAAFSGAAEIVRARYTGTPRHKAVEAFRIGAPALLGVGVGMVLMMFVDSLS
jgi:hypothetical protein